MLTVEGLQAGYGHSQVLFDISFRIAEGELVTLMGRNGMGKTTTIRTIMGLVTARGGDVSFGGRNATGQPPEKVARLGVGLVPEGRQIFSTLSVRENLIATAANREKRRDGWTLERVYTLFPRMGERSGQAAGTLSGGEQQMLAIGRALMTNPRCPIVVAWAEYEARGFKRQSAAFHEAWSGAGFASRMIEVPARNHFNILMELRDNTTELSQALLGLIKG